MAVNGSCGARRGNNEGQDAGMSDDFTVDEIDRAIVAELRKNGRATNQQIANQLGLTAATVSTRIRRMASFSPGVGSLQASSCSRRCSSS